jgi:hypothetical protein
MATHKMTEAEIRKRVQAAFAAGAPREFRALGTGGPLNPLAPTPTGIHVSETTFSDACSACGEQDTNVRFETASGTLAFHVRCEEIWREEAAKPAPNPR